MEHSPRQPHIKNVEMTKRGFMIGGISSAVALTTMGKLYSEYNELEDKTVLSGHTEDELVTTESEVENVEKSDSLYWNTYVDSFKEGLARDSELVIERLGIITAIQEHLTLPGIKSDGVRESLERLVPALAFVESRLDSVASNEDAFGMLQLRRGAWDELHSDGESIDSVIDQIKVAGRLLEQTYSHITQTAAMELSNIKLIFFDNDTELFEEYFMVPLVLNAYTAGMGTMAELLTDFVSRYPEEKSLRKLSPEKKRLTGHDVFYAFTVIAQAEGWDKNYDDKSAIYTPMTFAANDVLIEALTAYGEEVQLAQN